MTTRALLVFIAFSALVGNASAQSRGPEQRPATQAGTSPSKCPNLSGQYVIQSEDGQVHISIVQERCERISIVRRTGYLGKVGSETHSLTLDGKPRKDPMWFGGSDECCNTSAAFVGSTLRIEARAARGFVMTMTYSLTAEGDLLAETSSDGRGLGSSLARRQK